jgi:DMSO/TMAO reductase YedYZ heme-binding membrane subunit
MVSDVNKSIISTNVISPLFGVTLVLLATYLYFLSNGLNEITRPYAPPGQTLYVLSKVTALLVYVLMWWQIMLGIFKKINTNHHIVFGTGIFILIISHATFFITAVSIRQEQLVLGVLLPSFTAGYYKSGLSLGVIALLFIFIATLSGTLRNRFSKYWKFGHGLVYLTFAVATIHGLMIGSDVSSGIFSYIVYGAMFSLVIALIYQKIIIPRKASFFK